MFMRKTIRSKYSKRDEKTVLQILKQIETKSNLKRRKQLKLLWTKILLSSKTSYKAP